MSNEDNEKTPDATPETTPDSGETRNDREDQSPSDRAPDESPEKTETSSEGTPEETPEKTGEDASGPAAAFWDEPEKDATVGDGSRKDGASGDGPGDGFQKDGAEDGSEDESEEDFYGEEEPTGKHKDKGRERDPEERGEGFFSRVVAPWVQASRPSFFIASVFPVLLGYILARRFRPEEVGTGVFVLVLLACFLVHLATNLCNDYFEHEGGVDGEDTIGGSRVLQEGKLTPGRLFWGMAFCYAAALVFAILIAGKSRFLWSIIVFAAFSSFFYVAPPVRYGHRAMGEVMVFLNMGLVMVVGTYVALTGDFSRLKEVAALSLPTGFMVASILYFQSLPEIETDLAAGKKTLANVLGKERASFLWLLWYPLVWLVILMLWLTGTLSAVALLGLLTIPAHLAVYGRVRKAGDWVTLDKSGGLVKFLYAANSLFILFGAACPDFSLSGNAGDDLSDNYDIAIEYVSDEVLSLPASDPASDPATAPASDPAAGPAIAKDGDS
ncbi:MAG: UbiA family prenyltransferase, partial [Deltaproteobacteria bacterium]|nr:UbiA family prenyltransferase [Deltaproteobacteria bacterium]